MLAARLLHRADRRRYVSAVCPFFRTLLGGGVRLDQTDEVKEMRASLVPLVRMAHPDELKGRSSSSPRPRRAS